MPLTDTLVWQIARNEAAALLDKYAPDQYPLNVDHVAHYLGLEVIYQHLPPGISGIIVKPAGEDPTIGISIHESRSRQRFTLAHEIGHYIERLKVAHDDEYSFSDARGTKYDVHEFFADEFAGSLLMPEPELRAAFKQHTDRARYTKIARQFGVSVAALHKRVRRLQLNPPNQDTQHASLAK